MIYLQLALEFFKIGCFSFGGGYATIPFLYHISYLFNWYSIDELTQMIAVASITPGPVGINVATFAGYKCAGILGALIATVVEMFPSLILVLVLAKLLDEYKDNFIVKSVIETLKPISCALLVSVLIGLFKTQIINLKSFLLLLVLLLLSGKSKRGAIFYILLSSVVGVLIAFFSTLNY